MTHDDTLGVSLDLLARQVYGDEPRRTAVEHLETSLSNAKTYGVFEIMETWCYQLFGHKRPHTLLGWQAELLLDATDEFIVCCGVQYEENQ